MENRQFELVGIRPVVTVEERGRTKWYQGKPIFSCLLLFFIVGGCLGSHWIMTKNPAYMDFANYNVAPNQEFLFGTDTMGRDIFSMIWSGGKISLLIGGLSTLLSTFLAIVYGSLSGLAPEWMDGIMMRLAELLLSIPSLLLVILLQAILGQATVFSISCVIGITSWLSIAKVVRMEVRKLRMSEYVIASRCMGGGFFHILWKHLTPNFISSIMFMVVMNVRSAIVAESTLSFMGVGLPLEVISWGSMLSLSEKALLTGSWWIMLIPGFFLVVTLVCITNIGNYLRTNANQNQSNL
ncbi:MAG: ABC transporter permease [bacterium]|nr:ABC transporter permease [bacterium]